MGHGLGRAVALVVCCVLAASGAHGQAKKRKATSKPAQKANTTVARGQLLGSNGRFGVVYSLDNDFNYAILGARYTVEPVICPDTVRAPTDGKLLVVDIAIKNVLPGNHYFDKGSVFTAVDQLGRIYNRTWGGVASMGARRADTTLRPGQGWGQRELKDPFRIATVVPSDARIVKIMLNHGRKGTQEKTLRYFIAGTTKQEAGENGDPANVIAPLPDDVRDPADPAGAVALALGKATFGVLVPTGDFMVRLDSVSYTEDRIVPGDDLGRGSRYAVATVVGTSVASDPTALYWLTGLDDSRWTVTDSDGEKYRSVGVLKASVDEKLDRNVDPGETVRFRVVFEVPQRVSLQKLVMGASRSRKWGVDLAPAR